MFFFTDGSFYKQISSIYVMVHHEPFIFIVNYNIQNRFKTNKSAITTIKWFSLAIIK